MPAAPDAAPAEDTASEPFVHLHTHTEYSLLDGAARITDLVATAKAMGQPAVGITDHGVLYGAVELYQAARGADLNPIVGCEMYMAPRSREDREGRADRDPSHLVLLARDLDGYRNLVKLVSRSHLEGYYYKPRIDKAILAEHAQGLVCLSACLGGELPQAILRGGADAGERVAREHMEIFGDGAYFLELQDHGIPEEGVVRDGLMDVARRTGLPLVATNDAHYIDAEDAEAHDILLCLQTGARRDEEKRFKFAGPHFYLASGAEMRDRFAACAEAVANTVSLARTCHLEMPLGSNLLPRYSPIPEGHDADTYLRELCLRGLRERYGDAPPAEARPRLDMELDVIGGTGFAAYFLIVWDLIRAAREAGVTVGPGRGSSAGSLVAYTLRITDLCPLTYGLIFERFLNRERVQMPDIDIDFDDRHRDRVLAYAQEKYGRDRVAQIITFGTMAARAAIRDVGRVLDVPLADVDRLAKAVPPAIGITLDRALGESRDLRESYEADERARRVIDNARRLEGICRNASTHAAGVVIAPEPLTDFIPVQRSTTSAESGVMVTQFDMNGVQRVGLLKIDFLGLANLTVIQDALANVRRVRGIEVDIDRIPLDDPETYALLGRADTNGVFQMEAAGGKRILLDMQPLSLQDLGVANALNRPGPIEGGVIDIYMRRKRGEEPISYLLPELEPILSETYGTIIYQDQVMRIAAAVAGYTLGEADVLRAAMGKKDKLKMAQQREKFVGGATARGVPEASAVELWDLIAFFAGYGFPKAHAMAYALIAYQTAYLKANHPLEFMAALLDSRGGDHDKVRQTIVDCQARGLVVLPPDVNRSDLGFTVGDPERREILYGLARVKNVGEKVVEQVLAARAEGGPFTGLLDLCLRSGGRELNRRVLESLICCGACDAFGERAALLAGLDRVMDRAAQVRRERDSGQTSLFGDGAPGEAGSSTIQWDGAPAPDVPAAPVDERLRWERELLGTYLSDHPLMSVAATLTERTDTPIGELGPHLDGLEVQVGGAVREVRTFVPKRSSTGQRMAFVQLEDLTGTCEVVVFARTFEEAAPLLRPDAVVVVRGRAEVAVRGGGTTTVTASAADDEVSGPAEEERTELEPVKIVAESVYALDDGRLLAWRRNRLVHITVVPGRGASLPALHQAVAQHSGDAHVLLHVESPERVDDVALAEEFCVEPGPAFERAVEALMGDGSYRVEVRRTRAPARGGSTRTAARRE